MEKLLKDVLTPTEIERLEVLMADDVMFGAVRKVMLSSMYTQGTTDSLGQSSMYNSALALVTNKENATNEELGMDLRALYQGLSQLELGLGELMKFKKVESTVPAKENKAR